MNEAANNAQDWFTKADRDLRAAEIMLKSDDPLPDMACYHAQQCAEKYLKGYLVTRKVPFKFVHELAYLVRLCMDADKDFESLLTPASELQDYATDVRYPPESEGFPTSEDGWAAVERAKTIRRFILSKVRR